jgi:CRP/FNR family transcriptional regulator, cyclic AMP receptor protein
MVARNEPMHGYWAGLAAEERAELTRIGARSTFTAGSTLVDPDSGSRDVIIVWSGFTKVVPATGNRNIVLALRGPGDIIGEMASTSGDQRSAGIAIDRVEALTVPRESFAQFLAGSGHASDLLRRTLVDRLREADGDRLAAASMSVGQRLARLLLKLAARYGVRGPTGEVTVGLLPQRELAACVGGARRSVARELALWREREIISIARRSVTVHRPEALARIAYKAGDRREALGATDAFAELVGEHASVLDLGEAGVVGVRRPTGIRPGDAPGDGVVSEEEPPADAQPDPAPLAAGLDAVEVKPSGRRPGFLRLGQDALHYLWRFLATVGIKVANGLDLTLPKPAESAEMASDAVERSWSALERDLGGLLQALGPPQDDTVYPDEPLRRRR